jgi:hypothetical protein
MMMFIERTGIVMVSNARRTPEYQTNRQFQRVIAPPICKIIETALAEINFRELEEQKLYQNILKVTMWTDLRSAEDTDAFASQGLVMMPNNKPFTQHKS